MDFELGRFQCSIFFNFVFHWLQQHVLVHGLQKDLQSHQPSHRSQEFNFDFAVQIAPAECRHVLGFSWLVPLSWFGFLTGQ